MTEQEQETLRRSAFVRHYEKGAFVHSSDTECLGMLFVLSGEIRTYLLSEEGREVTLFRLYPGELCVLSASCVISQITVSYTHLRRRRGGAGLRRHRGALGRRLHRALERAWYGVIEFYSL